MTLRAALKVATGQLLHVALPNACNMQQTGLRAQQGGQQAMQQCPDNPHKYRGFDATQGATSAQQRAKNDATKNPQKQPNLLHGAQAVASGGLTQHRVRGELEKAILTYCELSGLHSDVQALIDDCLSTHPEDQRELLAHFQGQLAIFKAAHKGNAPQRTLVEQQP